MSFPTPYTVDWSRRLLGPEDELGDRDESFGDWQINLPVIGWGPPESNEPKLAGHDREVVEIELMVPPTFPDVGHRDRLRLRGRVFSVIGSVERLDANPFVWNPGSVINLREVIDHG